MTKSPAGQGASDGLRPVRRPAGPAECLRSNSGGTGAGTGRGHFLAGWSRKCIRVGRVLGSQATCTRVEVIQRMNPLLKSPTPHSQHAHTTPPHACRPAAACWSATRAAVFPSSPLPRRRAASAAVFPVSRFTSAAVFPVSHAGCRSSTCVRWCGSPARATRCAPRVVGAPSRRRRPSRLRRAVALSARAARSRFRAARDPRAPRARDATGPLREG